jgi:hypothetical protein
MEPWLMEAVGIDAVVIFGEAARTRRRLLVDERNQPQNETSVR